MNILHELLIIINQQYNSNFQYLLIYRVQIIVQDTISIHLQGHSMQHIRFNGKNITHMIFNQTVYVITFEPFNYIKRDSI